MVGKRSGSTPVMSRYTAASPVSARRRWIARATASRGSSSSTKRSPSLSCRVAPSPRTASETRNPSRPGTPTTAVGWNCTNSRSGRAAPAARASISPDPNEPGGLVVRDHSAAAPPVASTTARACTTRPSSQASPWTRPSASCTSPAPRRCSSTAMAGRSRTRADSSRRMRRPVALPPACTTRRTPCPPSSPSATPPWPSPSKRTPSASRSVKRAGASSQSTSAAERRTSPRPAVTVSRRCSAGASPGASAAAIPPCAQYDAVSASGRADTSVTVAPAPAAVSAANRPAAPAPTTMRSDGRSCTGEGYGTGVPTGLWVHHDAGLAHAVPGHPERPARILALEAEMERHGWVGWGRAVSPRATREQLERVHPARHIDAIEALDARGGGAIDMDTAVVRGTFEAALRAAGGAVALSDALLGGAAPGAVSAQRPPAHHAETARAMGCCFFNNVAGAAAHARAVHGLERVLILDWDVHHGNGTNDIFHADADVLFLSIHEWPLYPGTGPASDVGSGAGEGRTVNLPVPGRSGDETYAALVEHVAAALIRAWAPELVLISAGFDAHFDDPLATCRVTEAGYAAMTGSLRRPSAEVGAPVA